MYLTSWVLRITVFDLRRGVLSHFWSSPGTRKLLQCLRSSFSSKKGSQKWVFFEPLLQLSRAVEASPVRRKLQKMGSASVEVLKVGAPFLASSWRLRPTWRSLGNHAETIQPQLASQLSNCLNI